MRRGRIPGHRLDSRLDTSVVTALLVVAILGFAGAAPRVAPAASERAVSIVAAPPNACANVPREQRRACLDVARAVALRS